MSRSHDDSRPDRSHARTIAENTTLAISSGIILTLIGLLLFQWYRQDHRELGFEFTFDTANTRHTRGHYFVPMEIRNAGSETVEDLRVRVELRGVTPPDQPPPASEFQIRFLSARESAKAEVGFLQDPARGQLLPRAVSFLKP